MRTKKSVQFYWIIYWLLYIDVVEIRIVFDIRQDQICTI